MSKDVSVVIVNWNAGDLLAKCLQSLERALPALGFSVNVIVVDNGSTDRSADTIFPSERVQVIRNGVNRGFAAACNQGAAVAHTPYLLFLNPDCEVEAGSLLSCQSALEHHPDIGVAGIALKGRDGCVSRSCHRFPTVWHFAARALGLAAVFKSLPDGSMREWAHDRTARVDHVIGAFYMVRTQQFRDLGGFDERFFVYLEDLDLSLRYRRAGLETLFILEPASFHVGGGTSSKVMDRRLFYSTRSRIQYAFKHFPLWQAWLHLVLTLVAEPLVRTIERVVRGDLADARTVWRGFGMLYRDIPNIARNARIR